MCDKLKNPQLYTSHGSKFDAKWHLPVSKKFSNRTLNNEHVYIMCQIISWAWANIVVVTYFRFKSVSPLLKNMQRRPETRTSKFYEMWTGYTIPMYCKSQYFFWLIQYGRHTQRHLQNSACILRKLTLSTRIFLRNSLLCCCNVLLFAKHLIITKLYNTKGEITYKSWHFAIIYLSSKYERFKQSNLKILKIWFKYIHKW